MPDSRSLRRLRDAVQTCRGRELWHDATQGVFGNGPKARLMLAGEQPAAIVRTRDRDEREAALDRLTADLALAAAAQARSA